MKKIIILVIAVFCFQLLKAQNTYKADLKNDAQSKIELVTGSINLTIIGHDKDVIEIESNYVGEKKEIQPVKDGDAPDRAKGLKPLKSETNDNTGIGLTIDKSGNSFKVLNISEDAFDKKYVFKIPNKSTLIINDIKSSMMSSSAKPEYKISSLKGEINITSLNSDVKMTDISGPVVANFTNGNIEVNYSKVTPEKPNSFLSVNGFVDISLPAGTGADLKLHTVNGEAFSDFEIESRKDDPVPALYGMKMFNLDGEINGGGVPISIQSVNGNIYLRKGK